MINNMEGKTYDERLQCSKLWTLEERRNRQDLIEVFGRPFVKRFALCYRSVVLSDLSVLSCL